MATHYQVLGVHSQSELASIRSAYLDLMKRFHPDRTGSDAGAVDVYRINLAWSVLRDDTKRAQYDAELLRLRMGATPMPSFDRRVPALIPRRRSEPPGRTTVLFMACAALACLVSSDVLRPAPDVAITARAASSALFSSPAEASALPVAEADMPSLDPGIEDAVALASRLNIQEAVDTSLNCYGSVMRGKPAELADRCIAFDLAFAYWHDGEFNGRPLEGYFLPGRQHLRHEQALSILSGGDGGVRLEAIRAKTFSVLVDILAARSGRSLDQATSYMPQEAPTPEPRQ
jgi:hypothetical protein